MKNSYSVVSLSELYQNEEAKWLEEMGTITSSQSPSASTIQKILGYSKALRVERSQHVGMIEQVLN